MSNGPVCCILGVCCPPPPEGINGPQVKALAKFLNEAMKDQEWSWQEPPASRSRTLGDLAAEALLANFDLVPRGVGRAIVEAYRPQFERALREKGGEASPNLGPEDA